MAVDMERVIFLERVGGEDWLPCNSGGGEQRRRIDRSRERRWHVRSYDGAGTGVKELHWRGL